MSDFTDLVDLASDDFGGTAIACNDDFFAQMENLVRARPAEWREHEYTDRGKWMDGWETRRRRPLDAVGHPAREGDHDWCIVRLGMPGKIRGVVVDTAYFRGNFPESCAISACEIDDPLDLRALERAEWTEILPRAPLKGDSKNAFLLSTSRRFTHVRLDIYPDGGVARLRVHGEAIPRWDRLRAQGGLVDLAALENGAVVSSCSDMFFGSRHNLIKPGPSRSMADGWETKRRRGPGNDWALVELAATGTIERLEIDTSHFKGNAPARCTVECGERLLVSTPLQPHTRHVFADELRRIGPVDTLRVSVFPCGGIARLRAWGNLVFDEPNGLVKLNAMSATELAEAFTRCCGAKKWVDSMVARRPYESVAALYRLAERTWWALAEADYLEAFSAHPKIGETGGTSGTAWSKSEQADAASAEDATKESLAEANRDYFGQFGFIYIVCASGRSAEAMLEDLRARMSHSRAAELRTAAEEQAKITRLRLGKLLAEL